MAYRLILESLDNPKQASIKQAIENCIMENASRLKLKEAMHLITCTSSYASAPVVEVLDRIIGNNMYEVPANLIIPTFKAFLEN